MENAERHLNMDNSLVFNLPPGTIISEDHVPLLGSTVDFFLDAEDLQLASEYYSDTLEVRRHESYLPYHKRLSIFIQEVLFDLNQSIDSIIQERNFLIKN